MDTHIARGCNMIEIEQDDIRVNGEPVDYTKIPVQRMAHGVVRYIEHGVNPGHFLTAIIENNLFEACSRADPENRRHLYEWAHWFYNYAPTGCWGSRAKKEAYQKTRLLFYEASLED
jgi:hypothetical protein